MAVAATQKACDSSAVRRYVAWFVVPDPVSAPLVAHTNVVSTTFGRTWTLGRCLVWNYDTSISASFPEASHTRFYLLKPPC